MNFDRLVAELNERGANVDGLARPASTFEVDAEVEMARWEVIEVWELRAGDIVSCDEDALDAVQRRDAAAMDWRAVRRDALMVDDASREPGGRVLVVWCEQSQPVRALAEHLALRLVS